MDVSIVSKLRGPRAFADLRAVRARAEQLRVVDVDAYTPDGQRCIGELRGYLLDFSHLREPRCRTVMDANGELASLYGVLYQGSCLVPEMADVALGFHDGVRGALRAALDQEVCEALGIATEHEAAANVFNWDTRVLYVTHIRVDAEHRGAGIGTALLGALTKWKRRFDVVVLLPLPFEERDAIRQLGPADAPSAAESEAAIAKFEEACRRLDAYYTRLGFASIEGTEWMLASPAVLAGLART